MRLIDADALKESIICNDTDEKKILSSKQLHEALIKWIDERETIDAAPVVHERWIADTGFANDIMSGGRMVLCSACGMGVFLDGAKNYCPNCGAKMDA